MIHESLPGNLNFKDNASPLRVEKSGNARDSWSFRRQIFIVIRLFILFLFASITPRVKAITDQKEIKIKVTRQPSEYIHQKSG